MLKLLAFDFGASSGRAILGQFDGEKIELSEVHRFPNEPVMIGDSLYWDILRLYHEMKQGIMKSVSLCNKEIASIGIDTWGVDFGLLDASGKLLGNPSHYRDVQTVGMIETACKIIPRREIYEQTGIQFMVFNTLYQLLALRTNNSPLLEKASTLLFTPDLFRYFLTGEKSSECSIASTSQMYNPRTNQWSQPLLDKLGISPKILTKIIDSGTIAGKIRDSVANELNIGAIPVVAVAGHDTASAVVSVPAVQERYAFLSSGTWSLLGVESREPVINDLTYNLDYTNEIGFNRAVTLLKNIMGLWIYQECKRIWDMTDETLSFDALEQAALKSTPFMAFIDPDDGSFYHPGNMPDKIREYCRRTGQKIPQSKGEISRCIMESLALKYKMILEGLEEIVGYTIPVLHIVGGGCKNAMLSQFTANAIARPVITGPVEATAIGNLLAQLIAIGEIKDLAEGRKMIRNSCSTHEYLPTDKSSWEAAYEQFKKIIAMK